MCYEPIEADERPSIAEMSAIVLTDAVPRQIFTSRELALFYYLRDNKHENWHVYMSSGRSKNIDWKNFEKRWNCHAKYEHHVGRTDLSKRSLAQLKQKSKDINKDVNQVL